MATFNATDLFYKTPHVGQYGNATILDGSVTPTAGANGDIYRPMIIPAGVRVCGLEIDNADLDTNGVPTIACKVGYSPVRGSTPAANDAYFQASGATFLNAAQRTRLAFAPITFQADVYLLITLTANAATFASGRVTAVAYCVNLGVQ